MFPQIQSSSLKVCTENHQLLSSNKSVSCDVLKVKEDEYGRSPRPKLLKEIQEVKKNMSVLQEQIRAAAQVHSYELISSVSSVPAVSTGPSLDE